MTAKHKLMLHFKKVEWVERFNAYMITVKYYEDGKFIREYKFAVGDTYEVNLGELAKWEPEKYR